MANQHYKVEEEVEITLSLKVTLTHISNYHHLNEEDIAKVIEDFKQEVGNEIAGNISGDYQQQEVTETCDWVDYNVAIADISVEGTENEEGEKQDGMHVYDLDSDEWSGITLKDFFLEDDEMDEKCLIIYKGVTYIANQGYSIKEFVKEYSTNVFWDMTDENIIDGSTGFLKKYEDGIN